MRISRAHFRLLPILLLAPIRLSAESTWTIPGVVTAGGLNNTRFVSDVTISNPGPAAAQVAISFLPSPAPNTKPVSLNSGETIVYRNVVASLFGTSGAGALSISSDQPLLIRARTYNTASSGTYGVALPVCENDRLLRTGETGDSLWISHDASGSAGSRTNIAVVFPDPTGGEAVVTVYDADGNERGRQTYSQSTAGFQQFSVGAFAGAVSVGRAQIHVTRGQAASYSVVVDNVTGDSSLFTFEDLPGGRQDVLINGVARANGRNGTFFRTDGRFYNPTDTEATVTVAFHASGGSNPSPLTRSFTLAAGKVRDVIDVLDALLGLPAGSSGALRFQSDWPVAILCRTSNVDPTGARAGTFGAQQKPVPILSFLTSADAGASITGIREDANFRTNVGFAAGEDGARYALTLTRAGGTTVATTAGSLGSWGWAQPNVQDLFPGVSIPPDATLVVKVTDGSLDVYDSSIDNLSGDPVVTPVAALPARVASSATIGPAGGSIRSDDGRLTLRVPAGALAASTPLSFVTEAVNDAPQGTGPSYTLSPGGLVFARPATLALRYDGDDVEGSAAGHLGIAFQSGAAWYVVTGGSVNAAAHTLTVPIGSTSPPVSAAPGPASGRAPAAFYEPPRKWAGFRSVQIFPKKAAVLTNGKLTLVVLDVGTPSSVTPTGRSSPLSPVEPSRTTYQWYLQGTREPGPSGASGVLISSAIGSAPTNNAEYFAPECAPANTVTIGVELRVLDNSFAAWSKWLQCTVRVLPRDWSIKATWTVHMACPWLWTEQSVYSNGLTLLSLGEDLKMQAHGLVGLPDTKPGSVAACAPLKSATRTTPPDDLTLTLLSGAYDPMTDTFHATLRIHAPLLAGMQLSYPGVPTPVTTDASALEIRDEFVFTEGANDVPYQSPGIWGPNSWVSLDVSLIPQAKQCPR